VHTSGDPSVVTSSVQPVYPRARVHDCPLAVSLDLLAGPVVDRLDRTYQQIPGAA
jgi:hypothetical protein